MEKQLLIPELAVNDAKAAIQYYAEVLHAKVHHVYTADQLSPNAWFSIKGKEVVDSLLEFRGLKFKVYDGITKEQDACCDGKSYANLFNVHLLFDNEAEARRIFEDFGKEGSVKTPFEKQGWGAFFGMVADKFGMLWSVLCYNYN